MKMASITETPGIHSRILVSDIIVSTLDGSQIPNRKICKRCEILYPISAFYRESKPKRKHVNSTRDICVDCWNKEAAARRNLKYLMTSASWPSVLNFI
jgi:hypothetical protein